MCTLLLNTKQFFQTVSFSINGLFPPVKNNMHPDIVKVLILVVQPLLHSLHHFSVILTKSPLYFILHSQGCMKNGAGPSIQTMGLPL